MAEKRQLGTILLESGRISQDDVDRVLEYQRTHGGFFGQALVGLGILTRDEVDYFLSHQLDLPYIFPNVAAVDREAAALVTPEWALSNLAVPILRAGNVITVVAPEPLGQQQIEELSNLTGCEVQLALASGQRIRELIHSLYGDSVSTQSDKQSISLHEFLDRAINGGAEKFGVSVRGHEAVGWFKLKELERCRLSEGWDVLLNDALEPDPSDLLDFTKPGLTRWNASMQRGGTSMSVRMQALVGQGGVEYLCELEIAPTARAGTRNLVMPQAISTELRLLARGGRARVGLTGADLEFLESVLPQLPRLAFDQNVRAVHITDKSQTPAGVYAIATDGADEVATTLDAYGFDVITVDLRAGAATVLRAAPLTFVLLRGQNARELDVGWLLQIERSAAGTVAWDLTPAQAVATTAR
jgi:hypothetical protein